MTHARLKRSHEQYEAAPVQVAADDAAIDSQFSTHFDDIHAQRLSATHTATVLWAVSMQGLRWHKPAPVVGVKMHSLNVAQTV